MFCLFYSLQLIEYFKDSAIMIQIWGKQKPPQKKKTVNTKTAMLTEALTKGQVSATNTNTKVSPIQHPGSVFLMCSLNGLQKCIFEADTCCNFM